MGPRFRGGDRIGSWRGSASAQMTWTSSIVMFVIIWWMVFFAVLPWGIRRAGDEALGHDAGAPARPRLALKAAVTTGIAVLLFGVACWLVQSKYVSFH